VGIIQSGVMLDVQATVSFRPQIRHADIAAQLRSLIDLIPFPVNAVLTFRSTPAAASRGFSGVRAQRFRKSRSSTPPSPDGGTLLISGQTLGPSRTQTIRRASAPRFRSQALFTNARLKDEQVLLILIKPTIVVQRERAGAVPTARHPPADERKAKLKGKSKVRLLTFAFFYELYAISSQYFSPTILSLE
jgi:hypothetical protein